MSKETKAALQAAGLGLFMIGWIALFVSLMVTGKL